MIKGAVTLVTGGGSGLGKATVERLVKQGSKVVLFDLPTSKGKQIENVIGKDVLFIPGDVISENDIKNVLLETKETFGKLNNVINCAGVGNSMKTYSFWKKIPHSLDLFTEVIKVNTIGTFNVIRLAVGLIGENEPDQNGCRGVVINTASVTAFEAQRGTVAYASSKAAVAAMTLPLARDLASQGIRVVSIAPGLFDTPMLSKIPVKIRQQVMESVPFPKRLGYPDEFAMFVQTIIENPMLNGEVIRLDGAIRIQ